MNTQDIYARLMPPKKHLLKWIIPIIIALIALAGIGFWLFSAQTPSYTYKTSKPKTLTITQTVSATGTLSPTDTVEVGSQISGRIESVFVDINDEVTQGQVIARINPEKLNQTLAKQRANLDSARAQYNLSLATYQTNEWNYKRLKELYERTGGKSPSQLELRNAQLEYETSKQNIEVNKSNIANIESDVKSAEIDLKNSVIVSPINGIVLERSVDPGQTVAASFQTPTLFKLAKSLETMSLVVNVAESDIGKVQNGQQVVFSVDAYPDVEFKAKVDRVSYASTEDTTNNIISYETKILVDNKALLLRSGMSATANILVQTEKDTQTIPISALYYEPPKIKTSQKSFSFGQNPPRPPSNRISTAKKIGKTIYILKDDVPTPLEVEVGINDGINAQIISPKLDENALIITSSQAK